MDGFKISLKIIQVKHNILLRQKYASVDLKDFVDKGLALNSNMLADAEVYKDNLFDVSSSHEITWRFHLFTDLIRNQDRTLVSFTDTLKLTDFDNEDETEVNIKP